MVPFAVTSVDLGLEGDRLKYWDDTLDPPCDSDQDCSSNAQCLPGLPYTSGGTFNFQEVFGNHSKPGCSSRCGHCVQKCATTDDCSVGYTCLDSQLNIPDCSPVVSGGVSRRLMSTEKCGLCIKGALCMSVEQTGGNTVNTNRCYTADLAHNAQYILRCYNALSSHEQCKYAMDGSEATSVRFLAQGGSLVLQFTGPRQFTEVEMYRPPTQAGDRLPALPVERMNCLSCRGY